MQTTDIPPEPSTQPFVVITGGSEGIGLALAHRFAARGKALLLVARREEVLAAAATELRSRHGARVEVLPLDLVEAGAHRRLEAFLAGLGGHADVLVNNAAIGHAGPFAEADPELLERLVTLNVAVPLRLMRHFLPGMRRRRRGGILNLASLGGYVPGPWQAAYYASKAALISASEAIAAEVHADGVRVTVVAPGPVATAFHARMGAEGALYRRIVPGATAASVARWAVMGHEMGLRVVVPGFLSILGFAACRVLPHGILVPIVAALLRMPVPPDQGAAGNVR
jgi:hypothetical protein